MKDIELIDQTLQRIAQGGDMEYEIEGRDLERLCKLALSQVKNCAIAGVSGSASDSYYRKIVQRFKEYFAAKDSKHKPFHTEYHCKKSHIKAILNGS